MNKIKIFIFVCVGLMIAGCGNSPKVNVVSNKTNDAQNKSNSAGGVNTGDVDVLEGVKITSLSQCANIKDKSQKQSCQDEYFSYSAIKSNDPKLCDKILNKSKQDDCRLEFLSKINPNIKSSCDGAGDKTATDACNNAKTFDKAFVKDDINVCNQPGDASITYSCLNNYFTRKQGYSLDKICASITDSNFKKMCINQVLLNLANAKKDPNLCSKISDETLRNGCQKSIKINQTSASTNTNQCDSLKDSPNKDLCKRNQAMSMAMQKGDVNYCNQLNGDSKNICQDNYYISQAIKKKDSSLCNKISSSALKDSCNKMPK